MCSLIRENGPIGDVSKACSLVVLSINLRSSETLFGAALSVQRDHGRHMGLQDSLASKVICEWLIFGEDEKQEALMNADLVAYACSCETPARDPILRSGAHSCGVLFKLFNVQGHVPTVTPGAHF